MQFLLPSRGQAEMHTADSDLPLSLSPRVLNAHTNAFSHTNMSKHWTSWTAALMHSRSPAGQLLHLSVLKTRGQLWPCRCKTSGELLGPTKRAALLKSTCSGADHHWDFSPSLLSKGTSKRQLWQSSSGKQASLGAQANAEQKLPLHWGVEAATY